MKAAFFSQHGGSEVMQYGDLPTPEAKPGEVLVHIRAAAMNRVVVRGQPVRVGDQLVVLVSNYPGWQVFVDGKSAPLVLANEYLGATMLPGEHTYVFAFQPMKYYLGLGISGLTLLVVLYFLLADWWGKSVRSQATKSVVVSEPVASSS